MVVGAFDAVAHGARLAVPRGQDDHLAGREHRAYAHGQGRARHERLVAAEEAGVGRHGILRQRLDARARRERRERFVECDVSVLAHASQEEVDAAAFGDARLVVGALFRQVFGIAVEQVRVFGTDVHVREEVLAHEGVVALGVLLGQADVFVHVERHDVGERHLAGTVEQDQLPVGFERGRARGQPQHEGRGGVFLLLSDLLHDVTCGPACDPLRGALDDQSHMLSFLGCVAFSAGSRRALLRTTLRL